ncbi:MAG: hypothetical protein H0T88_02840, partial [Lysobacter sp.]|nr:hypothetical protein [Lysobacter sp.]
MRNPLQDQLPLVTRVLRIFLAAVEQEPRVATGPLSELCQLDADQMAAV